MRSCRYSKNIGVIDARRSPSSASHSSGTAPRNSSNSTAYALISASTSPSVRRSFCRPARQRRVMARCRNPCAHQQCELLLARCCSRLLLDAGKHAGPQLWPLRADSKHAAPVLPRPLAKNLQASPLQRQRGNWRKPRAQAQRARAATRALPRRSSEQVAVGARTAMSWSSVSSSTSAVAPAVSGAAVAGLHLARRALTRLAETAPRARCTSTRPHDGSPCGGRAAAAATTARDAQPTRGARGYPAFRRAAPPGVVWERAVGVAPRTWHGARARRLIVSRAVASLM